MGKFVTRWEAKSKAPTGGVHFVQPHILVWLLPVQTGNSIHMTLVLGREIVTEGKSVFGTVQVLFLVLFVCLFVF